MTLTASRSVSWVPSSLAELNAASTGGADQEIQIRLWDLLPVVRNHVYHPAFAGSFSLKAVLPALVPELTYEGMEVADGQDAGLAWESLIRGGLDQVERKVQVGAAGLLWAGHAGADQARRETPGSINLTGRRRL